MKRFCFPKSKRLVSNRQFRAVLALKLRASDDLLVLYVGKNDCGWARLGVSVGKSCGGAVVRNRLKRLFREVFRLNQGQIPADFDYLLMISAQWSKKRDKADIKAAVGQLTFEQVERSFLGLVEKLAARNGFEKSE